MMVRGYGFGDIAREHRRSRPDEIAAIDEGGSLTFAEFDARTNQLAQALDGMGLGPGDRLLWLGQNSTRLLESLVSCAKLGAIFCPVNWRKSCDELCYVLEDLDPKIVIWQQAEIGDRVAECRRGDSGQRVWIQHDSVSPEGYEALVARQRDLDFDRPVSSDAPLLAIYTAAFDGRPKAALLAHSGIMYQNLIAGRIQDITDQSKMLNSGPIFHLGTAVCMLAAFHHGATNIFLRRMDTNSLLAAVEQHGATHAFVPPTSVELLRGIVAEGRYDVSSLWPNGEIPTKQNSTWSPPHAPMMRMPGGYGQTEVGGNLILRVFGGQGEAGRPHPMGQVRILTPDGEDAPSGETGEIAIRGPMVMVGYHGSEGIDASRASDGWHRTNDLGMRLPDGSIRFIGPKQAMIKSGKENIYPAEVERHLKRYPGIKDVCVIGMPDPLWQQSVKAVIERDGESPIDVADVIAFCREGLASYKKPKLIEIVEQLPRLPSGGVDREAVDREFGGGGYPGH